MRFALSTCWFQETYDGDAMVDKALALGFDGLELGYGLKEAFAPRILARAKAGEIAVKSVHAFCPVPKDGTGHPELHRIANLDEEARKTAVEKVLEVMRFTAGIGAEAVVLHAGRVMEISRPWAWVHARIANERDSGMIYRWRRGRVEKTRATLAPRYLGQVRKSLDALLPEFDRAGVKLALENLPSWDALPQPGELEALLADYPGAALAYWHDIGHGQVMENAGFENHVETARRFLPRMAGTHIHDVIGPAKDHQAPGTGGIEFGDFAFFGDQSVIRVFEPSPDVTEEDLRGGLELLARKWRLARQGRQ